MFSGTRHLAHQLGLDAPLACVDGSHIVHAPSGREMHAAPLASKAAQALMEVLGEFGPAAFAFSDDRVFHEPEGARYLHYVRTWSEQTNEVGNLLFDVDWQGERVHVTAVVALVQRTLRALDLLLAAGIDKGTAIDWLAQHYGVAPEEIVAVGDWLNDIPMLRRVGRGFAMAQAPDEVKAVASEVLDADAWTGGGLEEAARRAGLI